MSSRTLRPGVGRSEAWAWAMFDFANSGYTTVVITAVYNAYFVAVIAGNATWASL
ncbi:MAG: MFS transporter, partial [Gallionellaceae bacterium]|nr:MFS transporter [Gallionellaceae bacterium]